MVRLRCPPDRRLRDCFFEWNSDADRFDLVLADGSDADCADVTMDERGNLSTGELIQTYPVTIDDDKNVRVDINADRGDESGTPRPPMAPGSASRPGS